MWIIKFNVTCFSISAFLIMLSLFVDWIYMANIKYKYQKIDIKSNNTAVKNAKDILDKKNINVIFKRDNNFFRNEINNKSKTIYIEHRTFFKSTLYDQINAIFFAYKYTQLNNKNTTIIYLSKIFTFIFGLNVLWTLSFSLWILSIIFFTMFIISSFVYIYKNLKPDLKSSNFTYEFIKTKIDAKTLIQAKKYLKYKKIYSIINILKIFSYPVFSGIQSLRKWGTNG